MSHEMTTPKCNVGPSTAAATDVVDAHATTTLMSVKTALMGAYSISQTEGGAIYGMVLKGTALSSQIPFPFQ